MQFCAHRANSPEKTNGTIESADLELTRIHSSTSDFCMCAFYAKSMFSIGFLIACRRVDSEPPLHGGSEKYRVCMHPTSGSKVIQITMRPPSTSKPAVVRRNSEGIHTGSALRAELAPILFPPLLHHIPSSRAPISGLPFQFSQMRSTPCVFVTC